MLAQKWSLNDRLDTSSRLLSMFADLPLGSSSPLLSSIEDFVDFFSSERVPQEASHSVNDRYGHRI